MAISGLDAGTYVTDASDLGSEVGPGLLSFSWCRTMLNPGVITVRVAGKCPSRVTSYVCATTSRSKSTTDLTAASSAMPQHYR
jgi:hypothetical protein